MNFLRIESLRVGGEDPAACLLFCYCIGPVDEFPDDRRRSVIAKLWGKSIYRPR